MTLKIETERYFDYMNGDINKTDIFDMDISYKYVNNYRKYINCRIYTCFHYICVY